MNREPVITAASIASIASAVVALLVAFGLHLSKDQIAALLGFVGVVAPLVTGWFARGRVTPVVPAEDRGAFDYGTAVLIAFVAVVIVFLAWVLR